MYADGLKQALRGGGMYGDGVGMGTAVMGMRWGWGEQVVAVQLSSPQTPI